MAFVFISADAADIQFRKSAGGIRDASTGAADGLPPPIRRPYRGIQIKDDTYATISIFDGRGNPIRLVSSSSTLPETDSGNIGKVDIYADFILQSITDTRVEKHQIIETFGDSFVFFFGERPRIVTLRGLFVNTEDFNWRSQFMANYEENLRGTKLVQRNARAFLSYDSLVIEGYPINVTAQETSEAPYLVNFELSMFLTNYNDFSSIGLVDFPGSFEGDIDELVGVLNRGLEEDALLREVSVTSEVRLSNLLAGTSGATLSAALRDIAKVKNSVFGFVDSAHSNILGLLSGRAIVRPVGTAGFFAQIGTEGLVASSSVSPEFLSIAEARGLSKVIVPKRTNYVVPIDARGRISLNIDEYPLRAGEQFMRPSDFERQLSFRRHERQLAKEFQDSERALINLDAQSKRDILVNLAAVSNLARAGFALARTIQAAIEDPLAVVAETFGLSGLVPGQQRGVDPSLANADVLQTSANALTRLSDPRLANAELPQSQFGPIITRLADPALQNAEIPGTDGAFVGGQERFGVPGSVDGSSLVPEGGGLPRFPTPP